MKKYLLLPFLCILVLSINWGGRFPKVSSSRVIFSNDGQLLRMTLSEDDKYRLWTSIEKIPNVLKESFLEKEDRYFYSHLGFNPWALFRSAYSTFVLGQKMGGSTITMQLARVYFGLSTRSVLGKLNQIAHALYLELLYSKEDIFEAYLNFAPYGRNIEGVAAASQIYLKKQIESINKAETLFLISVPQRPGLLNSHRAFSPVPDSLLESQKRFVENSKTKKDQTLTRFIYGIDDLPFEAPHFTDYLLRTTKKNKVFSTVDHKINDLVNSTVKNYIKRNSSKGMENASALLIDYQQMKVVSMIGSADFFNNSISGQINGVFAPRSPGSTLKPFIFALGMEQGLIFPQSILFDAPLEFKTPENFDQKFKGPITAEKALVLSRNVPAVDIASRLRAPNFYEFLKSLYPKRLSSKNVYGTSLSLGGVEFTMEEIVKLYAAFANQGEYRDLIYSDQNEGEAQPKPLQIFDPASVAMTMDILAKHPRPGANYNENFVVSDMDVFWKTGTSFGFRDAWSVGVFGNYVLAVWMGNFSGKGHPSLIGSQAAAPLFFEIVDRVKSFIDLKYIPLHRYNAKVVETEVCSVSGKLPNKNCPHRKKSLFLPEVSSIEKCKVHRKILIGKTTGLRGCYSSKESTEEKLFEVWPSHIMRIFSKLGMPRKYPPPYSKECKRRAYDISGNSPRILMPHRGVKYTYRHKKKNPIAFKAKVDGDVRKIHWYLDDKYLGAKNPKDTLFWEADPGKYLIRAIDDHGRQTIRNLTVITLKE